VPATLIQYDLRQTSNEILEVGPDRNFLESLDAEEATTNSRHGSSEAVDPIGDSERNASELATLALTPSLQAAATIQQFTRIVDKLDLVHLLAELRHLAATTSRGDLDHPGS
jgi:hypothetical protein